MLSVSSQNQRIACRHDPEDQQRVAGIVADAVSCERGDPGKRGIRRGKQEKSVVHAGHLVKRDHDKGVDRAEQHRDPGALKPGADPAVPEP